MKKITFFILCILFSDISFSQTPSGDMLVKVYNINGTPGSGSVNNPLMGNILYSISEDRMYHYNGSSWVSIDDQMLSLSNNTLSISGGNSVVLPSLSDGDAWGVNGEDVSGSIGRTGNVGIGTTSPTQKLHVAEGARITSMAGGSTSDNVVVVGGSGNLKKVTQASLGDGTGTDDQKITNLQLSTANVLSFNLEADGTHTVNLSGLKDGDAWGVNGEDGSSDIKRKGKVGIGTTNSPIGALDITYPSESEIETPSVIGPFSTFSASSSIGTAWRAFDYTSTEFWQSTGTTNQWLRVDIGQGNTAAISSIRLNLSSTTSLSSWSLQGSNDGSNWSTISTFGYTAPFLSTHNVNSTTQYRYFRLFFNGLGAGASNLSVVGIALYEKKIRRVMVSDDTKLIINDIENESGEYNQNDIQTALEVNGNILLKGGDLVTSPHGRVGIGTANPGAKLHVIGNIFATAVNTPDYVFEQYYEGESMLNEEYKFFKLEEVEKFIKKHKHLPGIPSAKDIKEQGGIFVNQATEQNRTLKK